MWLNQKNVIKGFKEKIKKINLIQPGSSSIMLIYLIILNVSKS